MWNYLFNKIITEGKRIISLILIFAMVLGSSTAFNVEVVKADEDPYYYLNFRDDSTRNELFGKYLQYRQGFYSPSVNVFKRDGGNNDLLSYPLKDAFKFTRDDAGNFTIPRTSLTIDKGKDSTDDLTMLTFNEHDNIYYWDALEYFENLTSLTISGVSNIKSIKFPRSLTSLTIEDCQFECTPDISNCTNLTQLVFTNNSFSSGVSTIKGLNSESSNITTLQSVNIDKSALTEIVFPDTATGTMTFSASECTALASLNFGGYKVKGDINLYRCVELSALTVNGYSDKASQKLDIRSCIKLSPLNLNYFFTDASNVVEIDATGINSGSGEANFSRASWKVNEADTAAGKYKLTMVEGSYLDTYLKANPSLFVDDNTTSKGYADVIAFKQDLDRYKIKGLNIPVRKNYSTEAEYEAALRAYNQNTNIRSYEANPIEMTVGQTIDDNTPYFYDGGTLLESITLSDYSVTITETKPNAEKDNASYHVISVDTSNRQHKVTALNPGIAYIKVEQNSGGGSVSATQKIIVMDPVTAATIDDTSSHYVDSNGTYSFTVTATAKYPDLANYSFMHAHWKLYVKSSGGYIEYPGTTVPGLLVETTPTKTVDSDGTIHLKYNYRIDPNAVGGDFEIRGDICEYKDKSNSKVNISGTNVGYKVAVGSMSVSSDNSDKLDKLGYSSDGTWSRDFSAPAEATVTVPILGDGYTVNAPSLSVSNPSVNVYDYLEINEDPVGSGKYKLKFKAGKTSKEIAGFLSDSRNRTLTVSSSMGKTGTSLKTFTSNIQLYGIFKINYDTNGGTLQKANNSQPDAYYIPYYESRVYESHKINSATRTGYNFKGWFSEENNKTVTTFDENVALGDVTLKAQWEPIKYRISYDMQGGVNDSSNPSEYTIETDSFSLAEPTRAGAEFEGWTGTNISEKTKDVTITKGSMGDLSFKAVWDKPYTPPSSGGGSSEGSNSQAVNNEPSSNNSGSNNNAPQASPVVENKYDNGNTLPTYVAPGKETVMKTVVVTATGETKEVALKNDGTVEETVSVLVNQTTINNPASINLAAPTIVSSISLVTEKKDLSPNAKVTSVTTVVEAKTINGAVSISPSLVSELKSTAAEKTGTRASSTNVEIKINTTAADGKPLSVVVASKDLVSNATLKAYAKDPVTGQYIKLDIPAVKYDKKTGLTTQGLVSGLEYHYVSTSEAKAIENSIYNSAKVSDTFSKPVQALPGSVFNMNLAISPNFCMANASKIQYSVSGNSAVIDPVTGLLTIKGNAKKGTITVSIKITLTNGKTKTIKAKIKIS